MPKATGKNRITALSPPVMQGNGGAITTSALHSTQLTLSTMHRTLPRPTLLPLYTTPHSTISTKWSAEEHRDVAADVVQAIVEGVNVLILAKAWQRDQDDDEAGLHDKPSEGKG